MARHVARTKTKGMTDGQVLGFIAENDGFRKSLAGHLHEALDAEELRAIYELRRRLHIGEGRWLKLYAEHNRKGLDGVYMGAIKDGEARFAQHKLTSNPQQLKKAAAKTSKAVRADTELVVARGTKVDPGTAKGLHGVRQTGNTAKGIRGMVENAADPEKVLQTGADAAARLTAGMAGRAFGAGAAISVALDVNKLRKGELSVDEVAENAAWAGSEAAVGALASAAVTAVAAETIAAGTAALAASSVAGTTAAAAGLAVLGPVALGVGACVIVGFGFKRMRRWLRG